MNTPLMCAPNQQEKAPPLSPSETRKRSKNLPRRVFSAATRTFLTLALATCAFGVAASAQSISISDPTNTFEGNSGQTIYDFTVSIDQAPTTDVTVNFSLNNGTATGSATGAFPADFANSVGPGGSVLVDGVTPTTTPPNTITFPAGSVASHTISVPVTGDTAFEADETFTVTLSGVSGGASIGDGTALATIANDDNQPFVSIADAGVVPEGDTGTRNANFTVSLTEPSGQDVTFTYTTTVVDPLNAGDGNNGDRDFIPQTNQVGIIRAGQTSTNIIVPVVGDTIDEADGQFVVDISDVNGAVLANSTATATIDDDDGPIVSVSDATASEADGVIVFRIQLNAPSPEPIDLLVRTGSNSARAGSDYGTAGATTEFEQTVRFEAFTGDPSTGVAPFQDVAVPIIDDQISEPTEIFNFSIITGNNDAVLTGPGSRRQAIGTILDNDGAPSLRVEVPSNPIIEGNAGNTAAVFRITLSNASSRTTTFRYETINGTARAGEDFTGLSARTGTIVAGQTSTTVTVNIIGDLVDEPNETFGLRVFAANPTDVTFGGAAEQTATATIIDDDGPEISIAPANVTVREGDNGARTASAFTVRLNATSTQPVTVNYELGSQDINEAIIGRDYTATQRGRLTFNPGVNTQQIPVSIIGDNIRESNEIITLTLTAPTGGSLAATSTGTITITDDDATPTLNISGPGAPREGSTNGITNFVFRVALDRPSSTDITVNFTVNDGTAVANTAPAGTAPTGDFNVPTSSVLTFPAGTIGPLNILVPVIADRLNEDNETFSVSLSNPVGGRIGTGNVTATIVNDDAVPALFIRDVAGLETGDPPPQGQQQGPRVLQFPIQLSAASGKDITFSYQTTGAVTGNIYTALSGIDFNPAQGQVTIPAGQTTATISVTIIADTLNENNETFAVTLTNVTNAILGRGGAIGSITDDDNAPNIEIEDPEDDNTAIEPYRVSTGANAPFVNGRNAVFPVTLSTASGIPVTVRYSISPARQNGATAADFLAPDPINPNVGDPRRVFQTGTLTFPVVNGATPLTQNIILFPRGDDGNEPEEEGYVVTLTQVFNANIAAAADGNAASTIVDNDPSFTNFSPNAGFESFGNVDGTIITITGDQFVTNNVDRVQAVRFTRPNGSFLDVPRGNFVTLTDDTITLRLPPLAFSSFITVILTDGRVLNSTAPGSRRVFFAQPVVTSFTPTEGVPAVTAVTITGRHFLDTTNPVTEVRFNNLPSTPANADRGFTVVSDVQIIAYVPRGATSGPISIGTRFGGVGPGSEQTFTVNGFATGGLRFVAADTSRIFENARASVANGRVIVPVRAFDLQLRPATQNNGNNNPIANRRNVDVTVTLNAAVPAGFSQVLPTIQLDPRVRISGVTLVRASSNSFTFRIAAGRDPNLTIPIIITYAGNDDAPPALAGVLPDSTEIGTGLVLPAAGSGVNMTLRAEITASGDTELYPNNEFQELTFERRDIHTFDTDPGTAIRTSEDPIATNNRASFAINLANLDFPNPDPSTPSPAGSTPLINTDARPTRDVTVTFTSDAPDEGLLSYYVLINGQKFYPAGDIPQPTKPIRFATNPRDPEYYRNQHFVEVVGQDDQDADGDQTFFVRATSVVSQDREYNIGTLGLPYLIVNTDNEQRATGPAFLFSKTTLATDEAGQQDVFTARLRTAPTGNVVLNFQSTRVDEVLFVDPNNPEGPGLDSFSVTFLPGTVTGNGRTTTNWRTPIVVRVRGVDDDIRDGDQQVVIETSVTSSGDSSYRTIDPPDLIDTNRDNEANGITVFPTNLTVNENATTTFSVRLNARPTSNVVITLSSSDPTAVAIQSATTLTFTPSNFNTPQTVTVRGLPDGGFVQQRTATIVTSAASSGDTNFNGLDVADVSVTVFNNDSAFVVNAPAAGLNTSEGGTNDTFTVSLGQAPTSNVQVVLSVNPASEARLSRTTAGATASVTLTFTPTNYFNPQTVNVIGQDDTIADGDKVFTISGRVVTNDAAFANQPFNAITGVNADNDSGTGGNGGGGNANSPTFAANSTYTFSTPYAIGTGPVATIPIRSLFTQSTASDFKIYYFNTFGQRNSRVIGEDLQLIPNTGSIQRGIGYVLQTGATPLTLKTPPAVQAYAGAGIAFSLRRNTNFTNDTVYSNTDNGLNLIGFPFNPAQFNGVSFSSAMVQSGSDIYQSVREAAAAGVMSDKLYTMDARGVLTEVPASNQVLRPYGAYFVRIFRDNVTLTLRSPTAN